jgi:hypothetical protein
VLYARNAQGREFEPKKKTGDVPTLALDMVPFLFSRDRISVCNRTSTVLSMISSAPARCGNDEDYRHSDVILPSDARLDE